MPTPPTPFAPAVLLLAASRLGWRFVTRGPACDLGELVDDAGRAKPLLVARGAAPGSDIWAIVDALPEGFPPTAYLVSQATFDILHDGEEGRDGAIDYQGRSFRVRVWYDGVNLTAEAIQA